MRNLDVELKKIIEFAEKNENIRGLVLQGSYVNDNAPKDIFSDLDPLFYCNDVTEFTEDDSLKKHFGEVISEFSDSWEMHGEKGYTRLTLYKDGFKIDFGFQPVSLAKHANDMELYKVYLDKDNIIPTPEVTDDSKFYVKKPTEQEFKDILRDFFFDTSYVVKTIYRDEIMFNQYMMNYILHKKILSLVEWYIGCKHDFKVNTGVYGRYIKQYLTESEYSLLKETYPSSNYEETKYSLIKSFELVRYLGNYIALKLGFNYPQKLDEDMLEYVMEWMRKQ